LKYPFIEKVGKKKMFKSVLLKRSLFVCDSPITATNRPRKKIFHPLNSAFYL